MSSLRAQKKPRNDMARHTLALAITRFCRVAPPACNTMTVVPFTEEELAIAGG